MMHFRLLFWVVVFYIALLRTFVCLHKYLLFVYLVNFEAMKVKQRNYISPLYMLNIQLESLTIRFLFFSTLNDASIKVCTLFETLCFILMTEIEQSSFISSSTLPKV